MNRQNGFSVVEGLLVVVVLVIIGAVGYLAYTNLWSPKPAADETASTASAQVKVENTNDLNTASTALDNVSLDDSDSSQLDSAANSF
jgi:Tfp pilus assembly protein PilE